MRTRAGLRGQHNQDETTVAVKIKTRKDLCFMTIARDSPDRSVWTGRPDKSAWIGQPGQDREERIARI
jgi:hypothetical protein